MSNDLYRFVGAFQFVDVTWNSSIVTMQMYKKKEW